jgi:hypothetical protein
VAVGLLPFATEAAAICIDEASRAVAVDPEWIERCVAGVCQPAMLTPDCGNIRHRAKDCRSEADTSSLAIWLAGDGDTDGARAAMRRGARCRFVEDTLAPTALSPAP